MSVNPRRRDDHRYLLGLVAAFAVEWALLAVHPVDRTDWVAENVLVILFAAVLALSYRYLILSRTAYTLFFCFSACTRSAPTIPMPACPTMPGSNASPAIR